MDCYSDWWPWILPWELGPLMTNSRFSALLDELCGYLWAEWSESTLWPLNLICSIVVHWHRLLGCNSRFLVVESVFPPSGSSNTNDTSCVSSWVTNGPFLPSCVSKWFWWRLERNEISFVTSLEKNLFLIRNLLIVSSDAFSFVRVLVFLSKWRSYRTIEKCETSRLDAKTLKREREISIGTR